MGSESVHVDWMESKVAERIAARVATVCGVPLAKVEPLVILKYEPGQYFKQHHDGSMRSHTVFLYLNTVEDGGETYFPKPNYLRWGSTTFLYFHFLLKYVEAICKTREKGETYLPKLG